MDYRGQGPKGAKLGETGQNLGIFTILRDGYLIFGPQSLKFPPKIRSSKVWVSMFVCLSVCEFVGHWAAYAAKNILSVCCKHFFHDMPVVLCVQAGHAKWYEIILHIISSKGPSNVCISLLFSCFVLIKEMIDSYLNPVKMNWTISWDSIDSVRDQSDWIFWIFCVPGKQAGAEQYHA